MSNTNKRQKVPGSGRAAGTPNKSTQDAIEIAKRLNVNPFEILLLTASGDWKALGYDKPTKTEWVGKDAIPVEVERIGVETRANAAKEACKYIMPQRKAVEVSNPEGQGFRVIIEDFTEKKK